MRTKVDVFVSRLRQCENLFVLRLWNKEFMYSKHCSMPHTHTHTHTHTLLYVFSPLLTPYTSFTWVKLIHCVIKYLQLLHIKESATVHILVLSNFFLISNMIWSLRRQYTSQQLICCSYFLKNVSQMICTGPNMLKFNEGICETTLFAVMISFYM
jgi:hypothetical protein